MVRPTCAGEVHAVEVRAVEVRPGEVRALEVRPAEWYSDEFGRLLRRAGLRKIRLHDSPHTTLSLMEKAGVPISIISKWAGHYDAAFTMRTYVHASDDDLKKGTRTLAKIHKIA
jgi:integrase